MIRACPSPSPPCRGRGGSLRNSCLPLTLTSLQAVVAAGTHFEYRDLLEQAKHEVFTEEEIVDESVMFYLVPCNPRAWQRAHQRRRERRRRQTVW